MRTRLVNRLGLGSLSALVVMSAIVVGQFAAVATVSALDSRTFTGTIASTDPTMGVVQISPPNCLAQIPTPVHYNVIPLTILASGQHDISLTSASTGAGTTFASMYLYKGSFDPANGTQNCVAADNSGNPKTITYSATVGTPYFIVVFDDTFAQSGGTWQVVVTSPATADMGVSIAADGGPYDPGAAVSFTAGITNAGLSDAPNATVVVTLPTQFIAGSFANVAVTGAGYGCLPDLAGLVLTCTVATHPVGTVAQLTFDATLVASGPAVGQPAQVRVDASSAAPDIAPANSSATVVVAPPTFVSVTPTRVVDTRLPGSTTSSVVAGSAIRIPVTSLDSIPDEATSVVVNLTSTRAAAPGYLTLHACTTSRPATSNSNYLPGVDIANLTISSIGTDGAICLYTSASTDVIVDVVAYTTATGFTPTSPQRLADTRSGAKPAAGATVRVPLPAGGTHVISLTSTRSDAAGFLTAYDCDAPLPGTSNLNYAAGVDLANLTIASAAGELCVLTSAPTDIIVDHLGSLSAATGALDRLVDTRNSGPATPGTTIQIPTILTANPTAAINLTATQTTTAGYLTVHACALPVPATSNLNVSPGRDIANLAIIPTTTPMCVTVSANTHVIIDLQSTVT